MTDSLAIKILNQAVHRAGQVETGWTPATITTIVAVSVAGLASILVAIFVPWYNHRTAAHDKWLEQLRGELAIFFHRTYEARRKIAAPLEAYNKTVTQLGQDKSRSQSTNRVINANLLDDDEFLKKFDVMRSDWGAHAQRAERAKELINAIKEHDEERQHAMLALQKIKLLLNPQHKADRDLRDLLDEMQSKNGSTISDLDMDLAASLAVVFVQGTLTDRSRI